MSSVTGILLATDLTSRSDVALDRALGLLQDTHRELIVVHVIDDGLPPNIASEHRAAAEEFIAKRLADVVSSRSPPIRVSVLLGNAFQTIVREASAAGVNVIVIGAPRKQSYSDIFLSTTAERVIRLSDRPVLMVKQPAHEAYRRVLVAFDGSEGATRALQTALAIAPAAELRIVHAWWPPRAALADVEAVREAIAYENIRLKSVVEDTITSAARGTDAKLSIEMIEGNPYVAITNASGWADLVVLGTHSKGRLASTAATGSLARHLLIETACDLLISRP